MTSTFTKLFLLLGISFTILSCENEKETVEVETPEAYLMPLEPGKYIIYRLDSTVFLQAGRVEETHTYQEKHLVDASFTDNQGRTSYRIYRYLRDIDGLKPWAPAGTYVITPLANSIEVIENNLRVIKLTGPIKEGHSWKGNRYLASEPYAFLHNFSNDDDMGNWDFVIESIGQTEVINNQEINDVLTVSHIEELTNVPVESDTVFAAKSLSLDKYAKTIGLVYQEHTLWEYQPKTETNTSAYYVGFGVKRSLLEHN